MTLPAGSIDASTILYVDDEAASRKLFGRLFCDEFDILLAASVDEALAMLRAQGPRVAVLVTDYHMPERDGMKLLAAVLHEFRHVIRVLATAYAGKDVAIAAVNQGKVLRILEKPLDEATTRDALREAVSTYRAQALERAMNEGRVSAMRETLGFLAHELNTPLATVRGLVGTVASRSLGPMDVPGVAGFEEHRAGELLEALQRAERRALYCQSLVSTFVQSARDAYPGTAAQTVSAAGLVQALLDEFPFEEPERRWVVSRVACDFRLPGRRDLLYLVLCTLVKNALIALRNRTQPRLRIEVDRSAEGRGEIRFADNGPGIPPEVLAKLTREPVTTRAGSGGSGMGLMFCQRVMNTLGGAIRVASPPGQGATVTLEFTRLAGD